MNLNDRKNYKKFLFINLLAFLFVGSCTNRFFVMNYEVALPDKGGSVIYGVFNRIHPKTKEIGFVLKNHRNETFEFLVSVILREKKYGINQEEKNLKIPFAFNVKGGEYEIFVFYQNIAGVQQKQFLVDAKQYSSEKALNNYLLEKKQTNKFGRETLALNQPRTTLKVIDNAIVYVGEWEMNPNYDPYNITITTDKRESDKLVGIHFPNLSLREAVDVYP